MRKHRVFILILALLLYLACLGTAQAIPAFSRQLNAECTTCHTIYPELNEYGDVFLKNSYVYTHAKVSDDSVAPPPQPEIAGSGGDPELLEALKGQALDPPATASKPAEEKKKKEGLWLAAIPDYFPVSATATISGGYNSDAPNNNEVDLATRSIVLQAGASFRDQVGLFASYLLYSEGVYNPNSGNATVANPNTPKNTNPDLRELFLVWRHFYDTPINIKVGRFRPKLSLWKSSNKISISSFVTQAATVASSPFSIDAPEDGIEANAVIGNRIFAAAGIVNRKGQKNKEGYGHISYKIGGVDFTGTEPEIDLASDSIWDYLSITAGAYGYYGKNANIVGGTAQNFNDYYRLGFDVDLYYKILRIRAGGVTGYDSNPEFRAVGKTAINSLAISSEAELFIDTQLMVAIRYEYLFDQTYITERHIYAPYIAFSPLQNLRLVAEYRYENYVSPSLKAQNIANMGISISF